VEAADALVR
jgi:hypothetical protein